MVQRSSGPDGPAPAGHSPTGPGRWPAAPVAAVLTSPQLPTDIRHASKIDRTARRRMGRSALAGSRSAVRVLVTGASGLLGAATARALAERGDAVSPCCSAGRPGLGCRRSWPTSPTTEPSRAAAAVTMRWSTWPPRSDVTGPLGRYHRTNVGGTRAIIDACRAAGVSGSSTSRRPRWPTPAAPWSASEPNPPIPTGPAGRTRGARPRPNASLWPRDGDRLAVVAIRPHLVWGPGDAQLIARVVARARAGRLVLVGSGAALVDTTYVDNAADALVAALDRAPEIGGQALVVTNGEPRPIAELFELICAAAGVPGPRRRVPPALAYAAGGANEAFWAVRDRIRPVAGDPPLTRFLIEQMSTAHWFDQRRTRAALEWSPRVSLDQGFATLAAHYGR